MNVLIYSSVFYPSIGGVETISDTLAENFCKMGVSVTLLTETPLQTYPVKNFPYPVIRHPSFRERLRLVKQAELVFSNGASMALLFFAIFFRKPFVWTHNGYQLSSIDGLGWEEGKPSPLQPFASIKFHSKLKGIRYAVKEGAKLYLRRFMGRFVNKNIAATNWVARRQPLPNQIVLYTPYRLDSFKNNRISEKKYDFIYVGRLVSEKGVATLLKAFKKLVNHENHADKKLVIVGDGTWRTVLEELHAELNLTNNVFFVGKKTGKNLLETIEQAEIAIVPSEWEEPMGGVTLELMAAGKCLIVSSNGGHAECAGDAALTFPNGNADGLYKRMIELLENEALRYQLKKNALRRIHLFEEEKLSKNYKEVFEQIIANV